MSDDAHHPWDRRKGESSRAHAAFRAFRDLGPLRKIENVVIDEIALSTIKTWCHTHDWRDRAAAWDDELHRAADAVRLEAIREMHEQHARAGRMVTAKALAALAKVDIDAIPPYAAARLLELGTRLERETLTTSVEQLQGIDTPPPDDPWEIVARELASVPEP